jgi:aminopeptidase N
VRRIVGILVLTAGLLGACTDDPTDGVADPTTTTMAPTTSSTVLPGTSIDDPGVHAADGLGDSLFPLLGNEGYDVVHVDLELDFSTTFEDGTFIGVATLRIDPLVPLDSFVVDGGDLAVESVEVDGEPAPSAGRAQVRIDPVPILDPGTVSSVRIAYSGRVPTTRAFAPGTGGIVRTEDLIFSIGEPVGATTWMPGNDHPSDKAPYALAITAPPGMEAAAGGILVDTLEAEDGTTYFFEHRLPSATYLVPLAVGDLSRIDRDAEGYAWRDYLGPGVAAAAVLDRQDEMVRYFEQFLGPYPFEANGALVVDFDFWGALETLTLSTYEPQAVQGFVVAHEIAHQWVGNSVSLADWSDIWLNEGFATYGEWLWTAEVQAGGDVTGRVLSEYDLVSGQQFLDQGNPPAVVADILADNFPPPGAPPADNLFNGAVYLRGGLLLHALRVEIGDEPFFASLRRYADEYRYGNVTTADFVEIAEEEGGVDLTDFFQAWLFDEQMPPIPELGLQPPG